MISKKLILPSTIDVKKLWVQDSLLLIKQWLICKWKKFTPCLPRTYMYIYIQCTCTSFVWGHSANQAYNYYICPDQHETNEITNSPVVQVVLNKWTQVVKKWLPVGGCTLFLSLVGKELNILSADFVLGDLKTIVVNTCFLHLKKFH